MIGHAVADALDLAEQVGVQQDGDPATAQLGQQVAHDAPPDGVERARGLVEQQQARPADQGLRDAQALLHALRHRLDAAPALVAEPDQPQQLGALGRAAGRARRALVQVQELVGGGPPGEAEELGQIAQRAARRRRAGGGAAHAHGARRGPHEPGRALDQRRLARAVGPQQADELGLADRQVDPAQRVGGAVALGQPLDLERRRHERRRTIPCAPVSTVRIRPGHRRRRPAAAGALRRGRRLARRAWPAGPVGHHAVVAAPERGRAREDVGAGSRPAHRRGGARRDAARGARPGHPSAARGADRRARALRRGARDLAPARRPGHRRPARDRGGRRGARGGRGRAARRLLGGRAAARGVVRAPGLRAVGDASTSTAGSARSSPCGCDPRASRDLRAHRGRDRQAPERRPRPPGTGCPACTARSRPPRCAHPPGPRPATRRRASSKETTNGAPGARATGGALALGLRADPQGEDDAGARPARQHGDLPAGQQRLWARPAPPDRAGAAGGTP